MGSAMALVGWTFQSYFMSGKEPPVDRARITSLGLTSSHLTKDGKPILLHIVGRENQVKLYKLLGLERLASDPRFETGEKMMENRDELLAALDEAIRTKDREEWLRLFDEADLIAAPINNLAEAAVHPQAIANEYVVEVDHPKEGKIRVLGIPVKLHKTPGRIGIAPDLGQHTEEVLTQIAGYTSAEIAQLQKEEII
jgi:crotonobetainyl-CoA:carnitine CoA-transferase CaiB-like acyl-CoA transferase